MESWIKPINWKDIAPVESIPGIFRYTLSYNKESMLCLFKMKKSSQIPLHNHIHTQNGYCLKGEIRFFTKKGEFIAKAGDSYVFNSNEAHGAEVLTDTEVIEVFVPCRDEYIPKKSK